MATESSSVSGHRAACETCKMRGPRRSTLAAADKDYAEHVKSERHKKNKALENRQLDRRTPPKAKMSKFRISGTNGGNLRGGTVWSTNVQGARSKWEKENPGYKAVKIEREAEASKTTIRGM